jgi:hypothetical protein
MSDYTDSASEEYLSEHESDREFVEDDSQQWNDEDFMPESQEPSSEDFSEYSDERDMSQ